MNNFTVYQNIIVGILVDDELTKLEDNVKTFVKPPISDDFLIRHCMGRIAELYLIKEKLYKAERGL